MSKDETSLNEAPQSTERRGKRPSSSGFVLRVLTSLVVLPLILFLIWAPRLDWAFAGFITALASIGLYEYYEIVRARSIQTETAGGILAGALITLSAYVHHFTVTGFALYCGCFLVAALHLLRGRHNIEALAASVFGVVYVGWFPAHIILLRAVPHSGPALVTMLVVIIALTDAVAYLAGSTMGRHKMAPVVSPNKTWEGAVAGFIAALLGAAIFYTLERAYPSLGIPQWSLVQFLCAGAILSLVAQVGDLVESFMKRSAGVKDSGFVFPGHGGVLDRCDGYLFAAPVLYYIVTLFFHA